MNADTTRRLDYNADVVRHLLSGVSDEQARWKPDPDQWSLLEVVNHMADEERDDFRRRIDLTLHHPGERWPPIDPPRWVVERAYNEREIGASLSDFLEERDRSLAWLGKLGDLDLDASHEHPRLGTLTVGDLLASWLAHDLLHIRQMTRLHYQYLRKTAQPHSVDYAGSW